MSSLKQFHVSIEKPPDYIANENITKFFLNEKMFYLYYDYRSKHTDILYRDSIKCVIRYIIYEYLGYKFNTLNYNDDIFPMNEYIYTNVPKTSKSGYQVFVTRKCLYYYSHRVDAKMDLPMGFLKKIEEPSPERIENLMDVFKFEIYIRQMYGVTNINVIGEIIQDEFEILRNLIFEVGIMNINEYIILQPNVYFNLILLENYLKQKWMKS